MTTTTDPSRLSILATLSLVTFALLAALVALSGCGEVDERLECRTVCDRYASCFDSDYDVRACTDRCDSEVDENPEQEETVEGCIECIDARSCTESFACAAECGTVVP